MKELKYITLAQVVGCLLVILGHSYPFVTYMPEKVADSRIFIYAFHMPLFVFCSGYLFAYTDQTQRKTFGTYVKQRALKLLIPYFVLSLIGLLPKYLASSVLNDSLQMDAMSLTRAFLVPRENIWGHFWFLPMIFFLGVISYLIDKYVLRSINNKAKWGIVFMLSLIIVILFKPNSLCLWFGINDIIKYGWCYALGVALYYLLGDLSKIATCSRLALLAASGGAILTISTLWFIADLHNITFVIGVLMVFAILCICVVWSDYTKINKQSLIAQTYQIFILSWPCQLVAEILLERILHLQWWIILPIVFATGVIGPIIILVLIDKLEKKTKTHLLSFILGK